MKKIFFIFVFIFFFYISANAQWIQQYSGITVNFSCVRFINNNTGWVCGDGGIILKTTNSGDNWFFSNYAVPYKSFSRIFPVDSNIIYCIGYSRTIIKSTNGGNNWEIIRDGPFGQGNSYLSCFFINENTGWISGTGFTVLKTTDGGSSFDSIPLVGNYGFVNDLYFRNPMEGLFCDSNGKVRKTTNGGYNWFDINIPVGTWYYDFHNFTFINDLTGWTVTDDKKVFKTTDFGNNWDSLPSIPNGNNGIHYLFFCNENTGYSCGEGYTVLKTINGGLNWFSQGGDGGHFISFINDSVGWKIANLGEIHHTTNGGGQPMKIINNSTLRENFNLFQNIPNPFNSQTNFKYSIGKSGKYKLEIFNVLGKKVEEIFNKIFASGEYGFIYNAEKLSSGIYYYKLSSESGSTIKKFILIK